MERKSYIDRISCYGCKCEAAVANGHPRLQIKGYGCKSNFYRKKEELHRRVYLYERDFLRCLDEYTIYYNSQRSHRNNNYKSLDSTEKLFEKSML